MILSKVILFLFCLILLLFTFYFCFFFFFVRLYLGSICNVDDIIFFYTEKCLIIKSINTVMMSPIYMSWHNIYSIHGFVYLFQYHTFWLPSPLFLFLSIMSYLVCFGCCRSTISRISWFLFSCRLCSFFGFSFLFFAVIGVTWIMDPTECVYHCNQFKFPQ